MLKRLVSFSAQKESFSIWSIDAALFKTLLNCSKRNKIKVFALFMMNINRKIAYNTQCNLNALNVFSINETTQNLKDIKAKLSLKYHEFLDVFDRTQSNKLSSCCWVYWMFSVKLLKVKKYLNKNLLKKFITFSQTLYFFSVLFALKANKDL